MNSESSCVLELEASRDGKTGTLDRSMASDQVFLPGKKSDAGHWREMPLEFGNWNSVFQRYNRWSKKMFGRVFSRLWPMIPTLKMSCLLQTLSVRTSIAPGRKTGTYWQPNTQVDGLAFIAWTAVTPAKTPVKTVRPTSAIKTRRKNTASAPTLETILTHPLSNIHVPLIHSEST